jgi:AbrB family looped-hinge helix DNA binding protein
LRHGQITVPKSLRKKLNIHEGNILEVLLKNNGIFIKPKVLADTDKASPKSTPDKEWAALSNSSFTKEWDNEKDTIYDNWKKHYHL